MARGILVPWAGIEPASPALEASSLTNWTARKVPYIFIKHIIDIFTTFAPSLNGIFSITLSFENTNIFFFIF